MNAKSKRVSGAEHRFDSEGDDGEETFFSQTVKTFLGHCGGFVDAASFVIQSCQGDGDCQQTRDSYILGTLFERKRESRKVRRRQGGTLEFPADSGFEDDVSALSASTLEEMELLSPKVSKRGSSRRGRHDGRNQPYPGQQLVPPLETVEERSWNVRAKDAWVMNMQRESSDPEMSLGVATSGSGSTPDERPVRNCTQSAWQRPGEIQVFKAQVEA